MTDLKPCAHCGGESEMIIEIKGTAWGDDGYRISCKGCKIRTAIVETEPIAANIWNTRADDPRTVKLLEALEAQLYAAEMNGAGWSNNAPLYDGVKKAIEEFKKGESND